MMIFLATAAVVSSDTARTALESAFASGAAVVADNLWALVAATMLTAALCVMGGCVVIGGDGRGSGSALKPIELKHWSQRMDGRPAKHGTAHHKLEHNWSLHVARDTLTGAAGEEHLTGSLVGRQVWRCEGKRDKRTSFPAFNAHANPNSGDRIMRLPAQPLEGASHKPSTKDVSRRSAKDAASTTPKAALKAAADFYQSLQTADGHFAGDYGGPFFLMPGLIISLYVSGADLAAEKKSAMVTYLRNHQQTDGGWGLHLESPSTMFGTVMNYVALRLLGLPADDPACEAARGYIHENGGAHGVPSWGKFWLSTLGVYEWEGMNPIPPELWMLPDWFPFHPGRLWCHCRMVYLPMSHLYGARCTAPLTDLTRALRTELYVTPYAEVDWAAARNYVNPIDLYSPHPLLLKLLNKVMVVYEKLGAFGWLRRRGIAFAQEYIDAEDMQTNYVDIGPVSKSVNMLSVFYTYGRDSDQFRRHLARVDDYLWVAEDGMKMNGYNGSQLWDTAFAGQAFLEAGLARDPAYRGCVSGIADFVRETQVKEDVPQRARFYRHISKGGWPFSTADHGWPISDCTSEGLKFSLGVRALDWVPEEAKIAPRRLEDAVNVILSFQNGDGGWATYENTRGWRWFEQLNPAEVFGDIMIDYSYVECSSASVTALVAFRKAFPDHRAGEVARAIRRGRDFIAGVQRPDGSWYGSWGICFTYGTWFGIEGLLAAGEPAGSPRIARACEFLLSVQREDGGWGESYLSCVTRKYHHNAQEGSTVVNTAWALLGLMAAGRRSDTEAVQRGIRFLVSRQLVNGDWTQESVSGVFNRTCGITYTAYRNVFPLWALGRYTNEYAETVLEGHADA